YYGLMVTLFPYQIQISRNRGSGDTAKFISGDFEYKGTPFYVIITYDHVTGQVRAYKNLEFIGSTTSSVGPIAYIFSKGYNIGAMRRTTGTETFSKMQLYHWSLWSGVCNESEIAEIINKRYDQVSVPPVVIYEI